MAKNAKVIAMGAGISAISEGRHFLDVVRFKKFLDGAAANHGTAVHRGLLNAYERCMKGFPKVEVNVSGVNENGLATCHFYGHSPKPEEIFAPMDCLTAIKPVVSKTTAPVNQFRELDRLACA